MILDEMLNKLEREIKARGFTKKEVAQKLGISPSALSSVFTRKNIKLSLAINIAEVIGMPSQNIWPDKIMDKWLEMPLIDLIREICREETEKILLNSKINNSIVLNSKISPKK